MRALAALLAAGALPLSATAAGSPPPPRSVMMWLIDSNRAGPKIPDSPQIWKQRIANVAAHRENLTAVTPCIYGITASGGFGGGSKWKTSKAASEPSSKQNENAFSSRRVDIFL